MLASARRWAWRKPGVYALPPGPGRNVGRAISPAVWGLRHRKVSGTMQASSPTKHRAGFCRALQDISLRKAAMHPSVCALRRITGLRYPHHTAHAEACLHSATAAPAPSRFLRRRRRSTPQPLAGEPFQVAVAHKASPARGGAAAGGGGVRRLALPLPFRAAAAPA